MTDVFWLSASWVVASVIGLAVGFVSVGEALADQAALKLSGKNGVRSTVALASLVTEITRMGIQFLLLIIGIGSMLSPLTPSSRAPLAYVLTGVVYLLVFNSIYNLRVRRNVIKATSRSFNPAEQETLLEVKSGVEMVGVKVGAVKKAAEDAQHEADNMSKKVAELTDRATTSETRADVAEDRADASQDRADVAERRADAAEERE